MKEIDFEQIRLNALASVVIGSEDEKLDRLVKATANGTSQVMKAMLEEYHRQLLETLSPERLQ